jgi:hypothetical protein
MTWCRVSINGASKEPRAAHNVVIYETKMLVFGGYNLNGYINSEV